MNSSEQSWDEFRHGGMGLPRSYNAPPETQRSQRWAEPTVLVPRQTLETNEHRILIIPDAHVPYHSRRAWKTLLAVAQHWQPTCLVILGDFLDLYCVSFHAKKPSVLAQYASVEDEAAVGRDCLDQLDALGCEYKYYIMGNHEARLSRYMHKHSPMFDGLVTVEGLLGLEARGWEVTQYGDGRTIGELYITHDLGIAGKTAVRRSLDAAMQSIVIGHTHRLEIVHQADKLGRQLQGASFGWLGDFSAIDYMKKRVAMRQWSHGLGLCYMDENGRADMDAVRITDGKCRIEGHIVRAEDYRV